MGAGRKTETITIKENFSQSGMSSNSSVTARNLPKSQLGGVIFGCTHETINECLSKQLFGLPYGHYSYVKNIEAGLSLFLFNYSDRKLHGIYEATSTGQLYLCPSAWTGGESQRSPFPAQVSVRIKTQCQPLVENQYKKAIKGNYYREPVHFWFELDHEQTRRLSSLFKPSHYPTENIVPTLPTRKREIPRTAIDSESKKEQFPSLTNGTWKKVVKKDKRSSAGVRNENKFATLLCEDGNSGLPTETSLPNVLEDGEWGEAVENCEELAEFQTAIDFESKKENFPPFPATTWKDIVKKDNMPSAGFTNEYKFASHLCEEENSERTTETSLANALEWREPVDTWEELAAQTTIGSESKKEVFPPFPAPPTWKDIVKKDNEPSAAGFTTECKFASHLCEEENSELPTETTSSNVNEDTEWRKPVDDWEALAEDFVQDTTSGAVYDNPKIQLYVSEVSDSEKGRAVSEVEKLATNCWGCITDGSMCENDGHSFDNECSILNNSDAFNFSRNASECSNVSDLNFRRMELVQLVKFKAWAEDFVKKHQAESDKEMEQMRNAVGESRREIQMLKDRIIQLESIVEVCVTACLSRNQVV